MAEPAPAARPPFVAQRASSIIQKLISHASSQSDQAASPSSDSSFADGGALVVRPTPAPMGVWCHDLEYQVSPEKTILEKITICAKPGELTAVIGSSGAGKTSLINCLLDRVKKGTVRGARGLNGLPMNEVNARRHTRYVMSADANLPYLTVRETLNYTAQLRLPNYTKEQQLAAADEVIQWLQLQGCQDVLVGGSWRKGISKGQMKRLAIAQELLGNPEVLILDEPTTGLDSALALELVHVLSAVARRAQKTIVASIHQPSQRAFQAFDRVILLSEGRLLYHGPTNRVLPYFAALGRPIRDGVSPPDFLMEIATDRSHTGLDKVISPQQILNAHDEIPKYSSRASLVELHEKYLQSDEAETVLNDIEALVAMPAPSKDQVTELEKYTSWRSQFSVVWRRSTQNTLRNPTSTFIIIFVNIIQAILLGTIFFQLTVKSTDVSTPSVPDWPLWDNTVLKYLTEGIDRSNSTPIVDPLRDMIETGIDGDQSSMVFDIMVNPRMIDYIGKMMICVRDLMPMASDQYPRWHWKEGSIQNGDGSSELLRESRRTAHSSDEDLDWFRRLSPREDLKSDDEYSFGSLPLETTISAISGLVQVLDSLQKTNFKVADAESFRDAAVGYWAQTAMAVADYATPAMCCMGFESGFGLMGTLPNCAAKYPDYDLPTFPGAIDWKNTTESTIRQSRRVLSSFLHFAQLERARPEGKQVRRLKDVSQRTAPRRQLRSSGLGGLATDLFNLIFRDPTNPVYPLVQNLMRMGDEIANCKSVYCEKLTKVGESVGLYLKDLVNSLLSVLNIGGAVFFLVGNMGFMTYDVLLQFPRDRALFNREKADGLYRASSYLLAKMLADFPTQLLPNIIWASIFYFLIGFEASAKTFILYLLVSLLICFTAYSFGYLVSALSPRLEVAIITAPLILIVMLVCAGFMLRDAQLAAWIAWFRWFSIYRYAFFSVMLVQFPPGGTYGSIPNEVATAACGVVETRLWVNCVALLGLSAGFRILSYFALVYTNRSVGLEA